MRDRLLLKNALKEGLYQPVLNREHVTVTPQAVERRNQQQSEGSKHGAPGLCHGRVPRHEDAGLPGARPQPPRHPEGVTTRVISGDGQRTRCDAPNPEIEEPMEMVVPEEAGFRSSAYAESTGDAGVCRRWPSRVDAEVKEIPTEAIVEKEGDRVETADAPGVVRRALTRVQRGSWRVIELDVE